MSAVSVAVAGCSGGQQGGTATPEPDGADDTATPDPGPTVEERIAAAAAKITEATEKLDTAVEDVDSFAEGPGEFDAGPVRTRLQQARETLDAATPDATGDQLATIETMLNYIDFLEGFTGAVGDLVAVMDAVNTGLERVENEHWEEALDPLRRADDRTSKLQEKVESLRTEFESIDTGTLASVDGIDVGTGEGVGRKLEELADVLAGLDGIITALRQIATGMPPFQAGVEAIEAKQWGKAETSLGTAADRFARAERSLEEIANDEDVPSEFRSDVSDLLCQWRPLRTAVEQFERGARAADEGDTETAASAFEAADETLQKTDQC